MSARTPAELLLQVFDELRAQRAEIVALRADVGEVRGMLEALAPARRLDERTHAVLRAVREVIGPDAAFSARELLEHATLRGAAPLAAALDAAGVSSAKALGKLFRRAAGAGDLGGFSLERCGTDRLGALWRVRVCEFPNPQVVTTTRAPDHRVHRIK